MLKKKLKVFIIILEDLRGAYIMITSMLKVQDFKNVWKDYRTICIIAVAVVAVLLLLFIIEAVRAHKKAKAFKNQLSENKKLSREVEDLKANQNFISLQQELANTENKISYSRQFYNDIVTTYNTKIQVFPSNIVAGLFNFTQETLFEVDNPEARKNVKVDFNN